MVTIYIHRAPQNTRTSNESSFILHLQHKLTKSNIYHAFQKQIVLIES